MPKTKKTDLQVLRALLGMPEGKLTTSEKRAFQHMYDNVASGMVIQLSKKQRIWTDSTYDKFKLDDVTPVKTAAIRDKGLIKPSEGR